MVELSSSLLAGILAAQIGQLGFEAKLLVKVTRLDVQYQELDRDFTREVRKGYENG